MIHLSKKASRYNISKLVSQFGEVCYSGVFKAILSLELALISDKKWQVILKN
jgi:hypothetical protein